MEQQSSRGSFLEVLTAFTRLGLTSFGGPIAHLGYFRDEYVERRKWLDEHTYADLVALCQFLPGPASSQVGIAIGIKRAGLLGGLAAWLGFTLPSAAALILFAYGVAAVGGVADAGWLHGLKTVAVAVVALAVWGMAKTLCPDSPRASLAIVAAIATLAWPTAVGQVAVIAVAGIVGWRLLQKDQAESGPTQRFPVGRGVAVFCLVLFGALLVGLPLLRQVVDSEPLRVFDGFFRAGSLVFGGGHVVLPLLQAEVVPPGWVTNEEFIAGYGAAQAVPGPLFTFAAYLGTMLHGAPTGWAGGIFALVAIFLPAFLLVVGALPFWDRLRVMGGFSGAMRGINAAVVGLLMAALYNPVWTSAVRGPGDLALALAAFALLAFWRWPPWLVVILSALGGQLLALI
ncbi:MAG: chromate efflux transporter [Dehalococcoidia bacterium]|nr:chromate efflux transporter [Dehalococcoidia bacterium]